MKIWPIVTMAGLLIGDHYADAYSTARQSRPHQRPHKNVLDAEADLGYLGMPHRVATFSVPWMFRLENIPDADPVVPSRRHAQTDVAEEEEDPAKKIYWRTVWNTDRPQRQDQWGDPNYVQHPMFVAPPYPGTLPVGLTITTTSGNGDTSTAAPSPAKAPPASTPTGSLPTNSLEEIVSSSDPTDLPSTGCAAGSTDLSCSGDKSTIKTIVQQLGDPTTTDSTDPTDPTNPVDPTDPTDPTNPIVTSSPPTVTGDGGIGSVVGSGASVGSVPEPSTWVLMGMGLTLMVWFKRRKLSL
jgi:PEP-CTERM motif